MNEMSVLRRFVAIFLLGYASLVTAQNNPILNSLKHADDLFNVAYTSRDGRYIVTESTNIYYNDVIVWDSSISAAILQMDKYDFFTTYGGVIQREFIKLAHSNVDRRNMYSASGSNPQRISLFIGDYTKPSERTEFAMPDWENWYLESRDSWVDRDKGFVWAIFYQNKGHKRLAKFSISTRSLIKTIDLKGENFTLSPDSSVLLAKSCEQESCSFAFYDLNEVIKISELKIPANLLSPSEKYFNNSKGIFLNQHVYSYPFNGVLNIIDVPKGSVKRLGSDTRYSIQSAANLNEDNLLVTYEHSSKTGVVSVEFPSLRLYPIFQTNSEDWRSLTNHASSDVYIYDHTNPAAGQLHRYTNKGKLLSSVKTGNFIPYSISPLGLLARAEGTNLYNLLDPHTLAFKKLLTKAKDDDCYSVKSLGIYCDSENSMTFYGFNGQAKELRQAPPRYYSVTCEVEESAVYCFGKDEKTDAPYIHKITMPSMRVESVRLEDDQAEPNVSIVGHTVYDWKKKEVAFRVSYTEGYVYYSLLTGKRIRDTKKSAPIHFEDFKYGRFRINESNEIYIQPKTAQSKTPGIYISLYDKGLLASTGDGYFNAADGLSVADLRVRSGSEFGQHFALGQLAEKFYRPDVVQLVLRGEQINGLASLASIKPAPGVTISPLAASTDQEKIDVRYTLSEKGGGTGDVRVFVNGSAVSSQPSRDLGIASVGQMRSISVPLAPGANEIKIVAFNTDNTMSAESAPQVIQNTRRAVSKPQLHALIIGIQEFENPRNNLKYSLADAKAIAEVLKARSAVLFDKVNVTLLTDKAQTTRESILAELRKFQNISPEDVFVFYVASHGIVEGVDLSNQEYFLVTSNVGATSYSKLKEQAINQQELKRLIGSIPANKKLLLLDTCHSGAFGETLQQVTSTRGLAEDAAVKVLGRAVGSTILAASTSNQLALEGYQGHGLFTFVLLEALRGKADIQKRGFVTTNQIADYVEDEVPNLAEKVFKTKQFPNKHTSGQSFPLVQNQQP